MASTRVKDYLRAIYELEDGAPVSTTAIARKLDVTAPAASAMAARLADAGYIRFNRDKTISMTKKGEDLALRTIRCHRLVERLLVQSIDYDRDEAHEEATRLGNHISEDIEAAIIAVLDDCDPGSKEE